MWWERLCPCGTAASDFIHQMIRLMNMGNSRNYKRQVQTEVFETPQQISHELPSEWIQVSAARLSAKWLGCAMVPLYCNTIYACLDSTFREINMYRCLCVFVCLFVSSLALMHSSSILDSEADEIKRILAQKA